MSNEFIFKNTSRYPLEGESQELLYTISGFESETDENGVPLITDQKNDDKVFAKKIIKQNGSTKYLIRFNKDGKMYNPASMYDDKKNTFFLDNITRSSKEFKEVSYRVFDMYVKFLKTKNTAWLSNAERESE
jgi:hypothetical protein